MLKDNLLSDSWRLSNFDKSEFDKLKEKLQLSDLCIKILMASGINSKSKDLDLFLESSEDLLFSYDQLTLPEHLEKALRVIGECIGKEEKIFINGDPDADGITATTIIVAVLLYFGVDVSFDFPVRAKEGHGLQCRLIDECVRDGVSLIITTDCGTKDFEAIDYANENGIQVIVTDHHILGESIPNVVGLVNPHLIESQSYDKQLCGAGVAFKFMIALVDYMEASLSDDLFQFILAMAALGTLSDRMSLLNPLNRTIVREGVDALNSVSVPGIIALKKISLGYLAPLKPREVSRTITPRLNAPGRIGDREEGIPDSKLVVEMLIMGLEGVKKASKRGLKRAMAQFLNLLETDRNQRSGVEAVREQADMIEDVNDQRRQITEKIDTEIESLISKEKSAKEHRIILVRGDHWNSGVIGIDTDRLRDRFKCPAVIVTDQGDSDYLKGSARSIPNIDIYSVMERVQIRYFEETSHRLFEIEAPTQNGSAFVNAFGGHSQACGFSFHHDHYDAFERLLRDEMKKLPDEQFYFHYDIVDTLTLSKLSNDFIKQLDQLMPFGQRFEYPLFKITNCKLGNKIRPFGNKFQQARTPHVEFAVTDGKPSGKYVKKPRYITCVGFGLYDHFHDVIREDKDALFDVVASVDFRRGRDRKLTHFQLTVVDIRQSV